jgi:hypothetical protein
MILRQLRPRLLRPLSPSFPSLRHNSVNPPLPGEVSESHFFSRRVPVARRRRYFSRDRERSGLV